MAMLPFLETAPFVALLLAGAFSLLLIGIAIFGILATINILFLRR